MNDEQIRAKSGQCVSDVNGTTPDYPQECERLRQRIRELEVERDEYRHSLEIVLASQVKESDIIIPDEKDCLPFEAFAHELDEIVDKDRFFPCSA